MQQNIRPCALRKKSENDSQATVTSARIEGVIDKSLELLYRSPEEMLSGINELISLCKKVDVLDHLIDHHQLMSAMSRLFGEESNLPIDLSFAIGKLFLALSMVEDFRDTLSGYRVGAMTLGVVELELKRAWHRGGANIASAKSDIGSVGSGSTNPAEPVDSATDFASRKYTFSKKQEHVLFICLSILANLADDFAVLRKMAKKSLVSVLTRCLQQQSMQSNLAALRLLKKTSIIEETVVELSGKGCKIIPKLVHLLRIPCESVQKEAIGILYNLGFRDKCIAVMSSEDIYSQLVKLLRKSPAIRSQCLGLMYHLSSNTDNKLKFIKAGASSAILEVVKKTHANGEIDKALTGLIVNMTLHPLCAEELVHLRAIDHIIAHIQKSKSKDNHQILLKVLRNLSRWTKSFQCRFSLALANKDASHLNGVVGDPAYYIQTTKGPGTDLDTDVPETAFLYCDKHFWDSYIEFLLHQTLECNDEDLLVELIGILGNITADDLPDGGQWHDLLYENHSIILPFLRNIFSSKNNKCDSCNDDLKLEAIIWIGELCHSIECSQWIAESSTVDAIHGVMKKFLSEKKGDEEIIFQILFTYERLLEFRETRSQVVESDGTVEAILAFLGKKKSLEHAAERCLVLVEDFDRAESGRLGEVGALVQNRRYEILIINKRDQTVFHA